MQKISYIGLDFEACQYNLFESLIKDLQIFKIGMGQLLHIGDWTGYVN